MTLGIIIIFDHIDYDISIDEFIQNFNRLPDITFCLLNNTNEESFAERLFYIADGCNNVAVVNNNKRGSKTAVRYGERYLNSHYNLKHFSYIHHADYSDILKTLNQLIDHQSLIKKALLKKESSGTIQKSFVKNMISLSSYIVNLNNGLGSLSKSY